MPSYKGHLWGSVVAYFLVLIFLTLPSYSFLSLFEWLCCALLGGLFPDIDTKSKGQKIFYFFIMIVTSVFIFQSNRHALSCVSLCACLPLLVNHRGIFHSVWFIFFIISTALALTYTFLPKYFAIIAYDLIFFLSGVLSHLILDRGLMRLLSFK